MKAFSSFYSKGRSEVIQTGRYDFLMIGVDNTQPTTEGPPTNSITAPPSQVFEEPVIVITVVHVFIASLLKGFLFLVFNEDEPKVVLPQPSWDLNQREAP